MAFILQGLRQYHPGYSAYASPVYSPAYHLSVTGLYGSAYVCPAYGLVASPAFGLAPAQRYAMYEQNAVITPRSNDGNYLDDLRKCFHGWDFLVYDDGPQDHSRSLASSGSPGQFRSSASHKLPAPSEVSSAKRTPSSRASTNLPYPFDTNQTPGTPPHSRASNLSGPTLAHEKPFSRASRASRASDGSRRSGASPRSHLSQSRTRIPPGSAKQDPRVAAWLKNIRDHDARGTYAY